MGFVRRSSLLTKRSFVKNKNQNTAETTSNDIDVAEFQANEVPASKSTVINSIMPPNRKNVPNPSNLAKEAAEKVCRNVGAIYDALLW